MFRFARCDDLIQLKARYRDLWFVEEQAWGLKQLGTLFVVDRFTALRPRRVLEIGAGHGTFFDTWCHSNGIEYWMCDKASFYPPEIFAPAVAARKHTRFVDGLLGQGLNELPDGHFDAVFSISVVEHVPDADLHGFYQELSRVLAVGGHSLHTIDLPVSSASGLEQAERNFAECADAGFPVAGIPKDLVWTGETLLEPLNIQYTYYPGKNRDMWGKDMTHVGHQMGSVMVDLRLDKKAARPPAGKKTAEKWTDRLVHGATMPLNEVQYATASRLAEAFASGAMPLAPVPACPCGSASFLPIAGKDRFSLPFAAKLCLECGLICTDPVIPEAVLPEYYEQYYHPLTLGRMDGARDFHTLGQGERIFDLLPPLPSANPRVLEIGAGLGYVLQEFARRAERAGVNARCYAAEYNLSAVEECLKRDIRAIQGGMAEVKKHLWDRGVRFDVIILSHVLEHVVDSNGFLAALREIAEGAMVYIEVPGVLNIHANAFCQGDFLRYFTHSHCYQYTLASLSYHVCRHGFSRISGSEIAHGIFVPSKNAVAVQKDKRAAEEVLAYLMRLEEQRKKA